MDARPLFDHGPDARERNFLVWRDRGYTYEWLAAAIARWRAVLDERGVQPGAVVAVESDYSPDTIALLIAVMERNGILVPVLRGTPDASRAMMRTVARVEHWVSFDAQDQWQLSATEAPADQPHSLLATLHTRQHPGFILFTSGSSGQPKAVVHDVEALLTRFRRHDPPLDLLAFLVYDHLGGLNTLLHALTSGGTLYTVADRTPDTVCAAIARHRIEILPASPTFFHLLLLSGAHERHDLGSLRLITYGAEPMPQATLERLHSAFPGVKLKQTYGLIEVGTLATRSREDGSLWVKLGVDHRVVDGILQLRTTTAMLGYLDAPSPFTDDGWLITGDLVEQDGEYLKILGRASELINVGGDKVFPQEVEEVIGQLDGIQDVMVYSEPNAITGAIVCALVRVAGAADAREIARTVKQHCRARLARHKVPMKVTIASEDLMTARGKKRRQVPSLAGE